VTGTVNDPVGVVGRDIGRCPVVHLDFSQPAEVGTYWRQADDLRETAPAFFNTFAQGYWVFTRHDAVHDIYRDPDLFSSESFTPWEPEPVYRFVPTQINPPDHVKYRQLLNPWFSPGAVEQLAPTAREICRRLIADFAGNGRCDFIAEFALHYPTEVFLASIGLPAADALQFVDWVEGFFRGFGGDAAHLQDMVAALDAIRAYFVDVVADRRGELAPRPGDLASHLLHSTVDDRPLTDTELLDMLTVLVLAGLDTTRASLGFLFKHLAEHPEDRHRLVEDPALIASAVEESLRYYTIIFEDGRKVTRDTEFYGCPLKKGDMVCGLVAGANRDPRVYERAEEFVIDRRGNHHLGFAGGPHRCLGAHLARREMRIAVEEWLRVIPDFTLESTEPLLERGGGAMMSLFTLPLTWEVAS
jgi:cytochrome P450